MITGKTSVFGIIGDPVEHTLSPGMHNAAFTNWIWIIFMFLSMLEQKNLKIL